MSERVARIRIELQELQPPIWRRVDIPASATLATLHDVIQIAMGWTDSHLYKFEIGARCYGDPASDENHEWRRLYKARSLRLSTVISRGVERFLYLYDFGDSWCHQIVVESVREGEADAMFPAFVGGAGRCPPEDVGGTDGFMQFLEAILDPSHEDHGRMMEWYDGPFDPADIDERRVRMLLEDMAARRRGPLASHRGAARRKRQH